MRMEWALLSIQVRGQQENFTDPAPLEGSCNIYAEGGATEAYYSRVVCHSVRHAYLVIR